MMSKITLFSLTIFSLISCTTTYGDIGGNRIIANAPGRCWRVTHRDFDVKGNLVAGFGLKIVEVSGTGETDDFITYELTIKENFIADVGWDESKTKVYTGSGLIKSKAFGKVKFEIYLDPGDGEMLTIQGYYHPGAGTSDFDDRIVIGLPAQVTPYAPTFEEDCDSLSEGGDLG